MLFRISHGIAVFLGILVELELAGFESAYNRISSALRASQLHRTQPISDFVAMSADDETFHQRLRQAYEHDPKPQNRGQSGAFRYLHLARAGEFAGASNATVKSAMREAPFSAVETATSKVFASLKRM